MKKLICLALSLIMIFALTACNGKTGNTGSTAASSNSTEGSAATLKEFDKIKASGVLKVGMECNYAPFNWTQSKASASAVALDGGGYADGYDVQIAKKLAEGLGVELKIVKTAWDGLIPALTSGTIDVIIAGMSPTAERALTIDFSEYYYESELVLVVKADGKYKDASSLADFSGANITGQLNTFHYKVIDQIAGVDKQTALKDFPSMIVALTSGTIDGYVSELPGAVSAVAANSKLKYIKFADGKGFTTSPDDVAISVGLRKGSDMTDKLNEILKGISAEQRLEIMNTAVENQPLS